MKKVKLLVSAFALASMLLLNGCFNTHDGPIGPQGPEGPPGNANVKSFTYTIHPNDWLASNDPNLWYFDQHCDYVTPDIVDYGAVLFYLKETSGKLSWISLPTTSLYRDNGQAYTTEYQPWHSDYTLSIQWIDTHPTNPRKPTWDCVIKAIIIADYPYSVLKSKGVDLNNYEQVMSALNITATE
ncbi:MAG: hypothetical protein EPN82_10980 [Bacteroidetes bacterium]|nr:MAG: hypothetical protein EPN82_10980 [Bacteroidota bacterium]